MVDRDGLNDLEYLKYWARSDIHDYHKIVWILQKITLVSVICQSLSGVTA